MDKNRTLPPTGYLHKILVAISGNMRHCTKMRRREHDIKITVNGLRFEPEDTDSPYLYFVADGLVLIGKRYKLVWLPEDNKLYIGMVNAYRRK